MRLIFRCVLSADDWFFGGWSLRTIIPLFCPVQINGLCVKNPYSIMRSNKAQLSRHWDRIFVSTMPQSPRLSFHSNNAATCWSPMTVLSFQQCRNALVLSVQQTSASYKRISVWPRNRSKNAAIRFTVNAVVQTAFTQPLLCGWTLRVFIVQNISEVCFRLDVLFKDGIIKYQCLLAYLYELHFRLFD